MINIHQFLFQDLAAGFDVAEGEVGVKELAGLHLLVDDVVDQVADFLFVGLLAKEAMEARSSKFFTFPLSRWTMRT